MKGRIVSKRKLNDAAEWVLFDVYMIDGAEVTEAEFRAAFPLPEPGVPMTPSTSAWPMCSEAMAVHPKQVDLARKMDRERGAPSTDYDRAGRPVFHSERHKRAYIKAHGCHDRNSYS